MELSSSIMDGLRSAARLAGAQLSKSFCPPSPSPTRWRPARCPAHELPGFSEEEPLAPQDIAAETEANAATDLEKDTVWVNPAFHPADMVAPQLAKTAPLELNELIHDVVKTLRRQFDNGIEVVFEESSDAVWVCADAGMVEQVVLNLCRIACDAMPKGGRLTLAAATVEVQAQPARPNPEARPGRFVCLTVADMGCGMDKAALGRVFEPSVATKEAGTGLGLATVHGIVKQHSGWVEVDSQAGRGSSFRVYLPGI